MITLDDVRRIKEIIIAKVEWLESDMNLSRFEYDGTFTWITASCSGECIQALIEAGFDVYVFGSLSYFGCVEIEIR